MQIKKLKRKINKDEEVVELPIRGLNFQGVKAKANLCNEKELKVFRTTRPKKTIP